MNPPECGKGRNKTPLGLRGGRGSYSDNDYFLKKGGQVLLNRFIFAVICLSFLFGCRADSAREHMLLDFESDSELDQLRWECHTLYSLSEEHVTHGRKSLKMELYPSDYPGLEPILKKNDWSGFNKLCFDIYNPGENLEMTLRIDDKEGSPDYEDRYNRVFVLKPGMNRMNIPFVTLVTSGTNRHLNLTNIQRLMIFMASPGKRVVLYADNVRLVR